MIDVIKQITHFAFNHFEGRELLIKSLFCWYISDRWFHFEYWIDFNNFEQECSRILRFGFANCNFFEMCTFKQMLKCNLTTTAFLQFQFKWQCVPIEIFTPQKSVFIGLFTNSVWFYSSIVTCRIPLSLSQEIYQP